MSMFCGGFASAKSRPPASKSQNSWSEKFIFQTLYPHQTEQRINIFHEVSDCRCDSNNCRYGKTDNHTFLKYRQFLELLLFLTFRALFRRTFLIKNLFLHLNISFNIDHQCKLIIAQSFRVNILKCLSSPYSAGSR